MYISGRAACNGHQPPRSPVVPQDTPPQRLGRARLCGEHSDSHDEGDRSEAAPTAEDGAPHGFSTPLHRTSQEGDDLGDDCTPPAREGSLTARIANFAKHVFHKAASPLLPARVADSSSARLPMRSRRIAANPLSKYPVAKRGEIIAMQKMGFIESEPTLEGQRRFDEMFEGRPGDAQAMRELLFDDTTHLQPRRRRGAARRS